MLPCKTIAGEGCFLHSAKKHPRAIGSRWTALALTRGGGDRKIYTVSTNNFQGHRAAHSSAAEHQLNFQRVRSSITGSSVNGSVVEYYGKVYCLIRPWRITASQNRQYRPKLPYQAAP